MRFQCQQCSSILELDDCQPGELVECDRCGAAVPVPDSLTSPRAILGEFAIKQELGSGGMGTVYLAHQITLDRDVALKVLMPSLASDEDFINNFINEARSAAAINHPNIVQAYSVKCDSQLWYFAMEYIDGPTVKTLLEQNGKIPVEQAMSIAAEIIGALQYAWNERQIIHRDLKPDNIMINSSGRAKLADLGLARKCSSNDDGTPGELYGTPQYIAPELLLACPADARSDIYSLGATFYHILTGVFPYTGDTTEEIIMKHLQEPLVPIRERAPEVPEPFAALVENMMVKRPAQRYQSYNELAADMSRIQKGLMPEKHLPPTAQLPIDINSDAPLESTEPAAPASAGGKKKLMKLSSSPAQPAGQSDEQDENQEIDDENGGKGAEIQKKGKTALILTLVGLVVVLAIAAAAFFFLKKNNDEKLADSPEDAAVAADSDESPEATAAGDAQQPQPQAQEPPKTIDDLQRLVQQNSDQAFDEMNALLKAGNIPPETIFQTVAPLFEDRIAAERKQLIDEANNKWNYEVTRIAEEQREKEEREQKAAEEARLKKEQEEKAEQERKAKEERIAAIKEAKDDKMKRLHTSVAKRFYPSAKLAFQDSFEDETPELLKWREAWLPLIDNAEKLNALLANYIGDNTKHTIPLFIAWKDKKDVLAEDDKYTSIPAHLAAFDGKSATFEVTCKEVIQKLPSIQRRRYKEDPDSKISFTMPFELLLPEQQMAVVNASIKESQNEEVTDAEVPSLVASSLLVNGQFLQDILNHQRFEDFRSATPLVDKLKEDKEELERADNAAYSEQLADKLEELLDEAAAKPKSLKANIILTTIRRYIATLSSPDAPLPEAFKDVQKKYKALMNN